MTKTTSSTWLLLLLIFGLLLPSMGFISPFGLRSLVQRTNTHVEPRRSTLLSSVQTLLDHVAEPRKPGQPSRTILVGGKGGVGKTSVSSAMAVALAASHMDLNVLVVSTDPAHSLGDALDEDLRQTRGKPVTLMDPLTGGRLAAAEVDAEAALDDFRQNLAAFDIYRLADALGVQPDLLDDFGLGELSGLLRNPPPGLDELVALANVLDTESMAGDFDVVVVDTAPTGHTLRLLALPQFLDGLLGKLISLRMKLSGLASTLQSFFGNDQAQQRAQVIDNAVERLEVFRSKMGALRAALADSERTRFVVVTVPTKLGVAESKRLISELQSQDVSVTDIVVNQCVEDLDREDNALAKYYDRRKAGQEKWIEKLTEGVGDVSTSQEFQSNGSPNPIAITKVPVFDVELVGPPALAYVGSQCFTNTPGFAHLMDLDSSVRPKVVICGGKGGVGKTTTSSSLAVSMAAGGHKVALISTDPAHSVGDALDMNLRGGELVECPLIGVPSSEGSLFVLEVDPSTALQDFKGLVDNLVSSDADLSANGKLKRTLVELSEIFDTLPAGTDEVLALAKIINIIKKGDYDRIVLDTAPTGHTLRMLNTPGFVADLVDRLLALSEKINSNAAVRMFISSSSRSEDINTATEQAKSTLLRFQLQMYDLEDMFADAEQTEFLIVTVPTELAVRESMRLLNDLTFEAPDMPIKVRNIVVNQVLSGDGEDVTAFLDHVANTQRYSMDDLERSTLSLPRPPTITKSRYLDTEPRGVYGLKVLADELTR